MSFMRGLLYFEHVKWFHIIISVLFLSFAIMQWNDPDAYLWILMYVAVSAVAFFAYRGSHFLWLNAALVAIMIVALVAYIPDVTDWIGDGMPSITDSMQASSPYIEHVRESLGLLISLITMIFYLFIAKKKK